MTTYIKYQCTVCRREKTEERDTVRVSTNKCTITKACSGILQVTGTTVNQINVLPVAGLDDWYADGSRQVTTSTASTEIAVGIATSENGALALAVKEHDEGSLPNTIDVTFEQRRSENVAYSEYTYRPTSTTSVFTGKDSNGKILRIDAAAIAEDRIQVRVNGVQTTNFTATTNTITLATPAPALSVVNIRVQAEKETIIRTVTFTRNSQLVPTAARGSWANISLIRRFTNGVGYDTWWVYSIDDTNGFGLGKLKIVELSTTREAMLLLAHTPFTSFDRYLNFIAPVSNLTGDFPISVDSQTRDLTVDRSKVLEIYPPLRLQGDAYIDPETRVTESSSAIVTDDINVLLKGDKVLGPV